ncbi:MAG: ribose-phosphate pyrophosphokinase [Gammaproteobacteria bacterium]|nr:ribose-phosphate pyrophosphokinase [Gammaproteobacteria bacterium]
MKTLLFSLFDSDKLASLINKKNNFEVGNIEFRQFPDDETYVKINSDISIKKIIFIVNLAHPNTKILPLLFACKTARDLGATEIGLISPYLVYMRQDKQFNPGEGVTSRYFAEILSHYFSWIITVDPHLHRYHGLNEVYKIPTTVLHAIDSISKWITDNINKPIIIGPDQESKQWAETIAKKINSPFVILNKIRKGDRSVEISSPEVSQYPNHTPVLIDDIISSGKTMLESIKNLNALKMKSCVCIGIHAIFAGNAYQDLLNAGARVVTTNSIPHISNEIDLSHLIFDAVRAY